MAQPSIPKDHVHALSEACARDINRFQVVAKRYLDDQPRLVRFFRDNMPNMPEKSGEVSLYLLAVILHIFYQCGKVGKVGEAEISKATRLIQGHAKGWLQGGVSIPEVVRAVEGRSQPGILDEALSALFERTERRAEEVDFGIMEAHRSRVADVVEDPATAESLKPWYRYLCKRPCFHDEYLSAFNHPNVSLVDCPGGIDRIDPAGPVVDGTTYELDCLVYATGFQAELTPLYRRAGHDIVGADGVTLADRWADGAATLFGMMLPGFPNLFAMPAPGQQAVVTVNYTQLAVLGAEVIGATIAALTADGSPVFEVTEQAEAEWTSGIVGSFVDASPVMAACTPSRINNEGHPEQLNPRNGNYGRGFGDFFAYRDLLRSWLEAGDLEGLEVR